MDSTTMLLNLKILNQLIAQIMKKINQVETI